MILIIGILIIIIGITCAVNDGEAEDFLNPVGAFLILGGLAIAVWGIFDLCKENKPQVTVNQPENVTDSTQVAVRPDSIYALQYVISWKDANGVGAGDVKFLGHTEKNVGDTLTILVK